METFLKTLQKICFSDNNSIKIGLSQLKETPVEKKPEPSIKNKDIKLSDLMRRAS